MVKSWVKPYWECHEVADENRVKYSVFHNKAAKTLGKVVKPWVKYIQPQGKLRSHGWSQENLVKYSVFNQQAATTLWKVANSCVKYVKPLGKCWNHRWSQVLRVRTPRKIQGVKMRLYTNPGESVLSKYNVYNNYRESCEVRSESLVKDAVSNCVYAKTLGKVVKSGSKAS